MDGRGCSRSDSGVYIGGQWVERCWRKVGENCARFAAATQVFAGSSLPVPGCGAGLTQCPHATSKHQSTHENALTRHWLPAFTFALLWLHRSHDPTFLSNTAPAALSLTPDAHFHRDSTLICEHHGGPSSKSMTLFDSDISHTSTPDCVGGQTEAHS